MTPPHTRARPHTAARPHLPEGTHVADRRGLTAVGAVAVSLGAALLGGTFDVVTGPGLRTVFMVSFILGCVISAAAVHREDLLASVVVPPLVFVTVALVAGHAEGLGGNGSYLAQQAVELSATLVVNAPALLVGTGLAAVIALFRQYGRR